MSIEHIDCRPAGSRGDDLEGLLRDTLGPGAPLCHKLGLSPEAWGDFKARLNGEATASVPLQPMLERVHGVLRALGAEARYMDVMAGARFSLADAGVRWERRIGPAGAEARQLARALDKLRLETVGLWVRQHVAIAGEPVDWAIAGLMPTGEVVRLAVVVRTSASPLAAFSQDLADDAVAAAGFELLAFRDWQLRYPGACALHVATHLARRVGGLQVPARIAEPEDAFVLQRIHASPARLTPRASSPNWALREALRHTHPQADRRALQALYEERVIERTIATSEPDEWTIWG